VRSGVIALQQVGYEQKAYWRNPFATLFTFVFPPMLLVIFGTLNRDAHSSLIGFVPFNQYFVPSIVTFGVMSACYVNLSINISFRREMGILKRVRGTPLPPWAFFVGVIGNVLLLSGLLVAITILVGRVFYDVPLPGRIAAFAATLAVGAFCFCSLALAVTRLVPNADAAPAVINGIFFPLVFISGTFFPVPPTSVLSRIASFFPVRHFIQAAFAIYDPRRASAGPDWGHLLVMAAWGAGALLVALRTFRWEPVRR
jgi:ABC-2 type transport system permease protein